MDTCEGVYLKILLGGGDLQENTFLKQIFSYGREVGCEGAHKQTFSDFGR